VALLNYVDRQIIFSLLPLLRSDLHLTDVQLGLTASAFLWTYGLLSPFAGYLADRVGRGRIIFFSLLVWTSVTWATAYATTAAQLLWLRALMGISECCYVPAANGLLVNEHGDSTRSLALGVHQSGLYLGIVVGGTGGAWLGQQLGWRAPFAWLGIAGLVYLVVLHFGLRESRAATRLVLAPASCARELLGNRGIRNLLAAFTLYSMVLWTLYNWLPLHLYERFGFSVAEAGFHATFYFQIASITGTILSGWGADRWQARSTQGRVGTQMAGLLLAAPCLYLAAASRALFVLVPALLLFGLGRACYEVNVMPSLCQVTRPELRSSAMGIFNLAGSLAGGFMTACAGGLKQYTGLTRVFEGAAVVLLVVVLLLSRMRGIFRMSEEPAVLAAG
jgi:MFS family permease